MIGRMPFSKNETITEPGGKGEGSGPTGDTPAWQTRALERSLGDARARSVVRLSQFVAAARELAAETASSSFTVQQVVERSGQSLKSFYRLFESKDDLLLALLEEDSAVGARLLAEMLRSRTVPAERVHAYVTGVFRLMRVGDAGYVSVLVREHRRLAETRPEQMSIALAPFIDLLADELDRALSSGEMPSRDTRRDAATIFDLMLLKGHDLVLGRGTPGSDQMADYVYDLVWNGLAGGAR